MDLRTFFWQAGDYVDEATKPPKWIVTYLNSKNQPVVTEVSAMDPDEIFGTWHDHYGELRTITKVRQKGALD